MEHTLVRFMDPAAADRLAGVLLRLSCDITSALLDETQPGWLRLCSIAALVDEQAPPPGPDDHVFALLYPPEPGTDAARLCDLITAVRRYLIANDLQVEERLMLILGQVAADQLT